MLKFVPLLFLLACVTEPEVGLDASYEVSEVDSLRSRVTFRAVALDTLWWKLELINYNALLDYGQAVYNVKVSRTYYIKGFGFWLDFTAWTSKDTVVVTFMSPG